MDADTKEKTETTTIFKNQSENPVTDSRFRVQRFRGRGRVGQMTYGGMRGVQGTIQGFGPPGLWRGQVKDIAMNAFVPRREMGRMQPYLDLRGHQERRGLMAARPPLLPLPPPPLPPPPAPMHLRDPFALIQRNEPPQTPPPGPPALGGPPPYPQGFVGLPPGPPHHFHSHSHTPRGYHNGPVFPPPHPPPGIGQGWPEPPGGRRF
ncbi:proline-rich protein HaeIII subfamily 1 [Cynoglossus semilaevis]|uniref:proline-rich protein HaeIII subfamily 1 n=1 Tax=Cynoglossus semilaevis TaxID=244447 RepID=UPI0004973D49|nr:proline-rich protein HaeIII subfamily 1-like [Cynoglossus semilaevis]XP_016889259.1 proline-rich protein HaeIII subfamily 1-like [Cynoglossus semilaevis]